MTSLPTTHVQRIASAQQSLLDATPESTFARASLATVVRSLRRRRSMTLPQLAAELTAAAPTHSWQTLLEEVEAGRAVFTRDQLDHVADVFAIPTADVLVQFTAIAAHRLMGAVRAALAKLTVADRADAATRVRVRPDLVEQWVSGSGDTVPPLGTTMRLAKAVGIPQPWFDSARARAARPEPAPGPVALHSMLTVGMDTTGLSASDVAVILGEPESRIIDWAAGRSIPPVSYLPALADVFDMPVQELITAHIETGTTPVGPGADLAARRRAAGLDIRDVATVLRETLHTVKLWEAGELRPAPRHTPVLDSLFYTGPVHMADPPEKYPHLTAFGRMLRHYRTAAKLNYQQAADALNVRRKTATRWENEERTPALSQLRALAELYDAPLGPLVAAHPHAFSNPDRADDLLDD